jgi:phenylpropionate dioxygenase-like ring-hydroxylating dioxygenase large terminal subunit
MHTTQERSCNSTFVLPRNCTFSETDWKALAPFWYPIAFSPEVTDRPFAAKLLDERLVLFRLSDSSIVAARDLCLHRGVPLSLGWVENDELQCKYHGVGYDKSGQCTRIPAQPDAAIPDRLKLTTYAVTERYGLVWVRLVDNGSVHFPYFQEWNDPDYIQVPYFQEWNDPDYIQVVPASVAHEAAAGHQVEGFLDVSQFAFVQTESFGECENPEVPDYPVERVPHGFRAAGCQHCEQLSAQSKASESAWV